MGYFYAVINGNFAEIAETLSGEPGDLGGGGPQCESCGSWARAEDLGEDYYWSEESEDEDGITWVQTGYEVVGWVAICDNPRCRERYQIKRGCEWDGCEYDYDAVDRVGSSWYCPRHINQARRQAANTNA